MAGERDRGIIGSLNVSVGERCAEERADRADKLAARPPARQIN
jgi:hypothetical protein